MRMGLKSPQALACFGCSAVNGSKYIHQSFARLVRQTP